ncbi:MAG: 4-carboxymuconolactone decarboxylase [Gammaproteobacteria bacterium]|jgi:4-carboxymuconolactone decarboxylase
MLGRSVGLTDEEMASMADPTSCASFSDTDKLVLRYSEILTRENKVSEALYAELEKAFPREELVELAMTIGLAAMVNRVHSTFSTDVDSSTLDAVADGPACPIGR